MILCLGEGWWLDEVLSVIGHLGLFGSGIDDRDTFMVIECGSDDPSLFGLWFPCLSYGNWDVIHYLCPWWCDGSVCK